MELPFGCCSALVRIAIEDWIVRSLGETLRLNVGPQYHHTRWVHLHLNLGLGAQHSVVDFLVQVLQYRWYEAFVSVMRDLDRRDRRFVSYLNPVARGRNEAQLAQGHGHIRRGAVRSPVDEGDRVRVVRLVDRCDRPGPDLDALVLQKRDGYCSIGSVLLRSSRWHA